MTKAKGAGAPALGYAAIVTAVLIWAGWIVSTRHSVVSAHTILDISLVRYMTPALLFAPLWLRRGVFPKGERPLLLLVMTLGWGGPFVMLVSQGLKSVPASYFGPLVPGLLPMVVALWGRAVEGQRIRPGRAVGLALTLLAVALVLAPAMAEGSSVLHGAPWLLLACLGWSAFTIAFRHTSLSGAEAAGYVCLYSTPFMLLGAMVEGTGLFDYPRDEVILLIVMQGLLSGAVSVAAFGYALNTLGVARASAFTCLVPVLAALLGWVFLGEAVGWTGWAAAGAACLGVLLVNRFA